MTERNKLLSRFGFSFARGGTHTARTIMLDELRELLSNVGSPDAQKSDYQRAVENENCLLKRTGQTRSRTYQHLVDLYSLDRNIVLFRNLVHFWERDTDAQPLLALLCAYARDPILRATAPFILACQEGSIVTRQAVETFINELEPGRFSDATLKSTAQNINSSWTKSGHLSGQAIKVRSRAQPAPGAVSYALLLGYLTGVRGRALFETEYTKLLDCGFDQSLELAQEASRKGWIVVNRVSDIIEVLFPRLINKEEMEWLREQS
jgi:hypothetical protein